MQSVLESCQQWLVPDIQGQVHLQKQVLFIPWSDHQNSELVVASGQCSIDSPASQIIHDFNIHHNSCHTWESEIHFSATQWHYWSHHSDGALVLDPSFSTYTAHCKPVMTQLCEVEVQELKPKYEVKVTKWWSTSSTTLVELEWLCVVPLKDLWVIKGLSIIQRTREYL